MARIRLPQDSRCWCKDIIRFRTRLGCFQVLHGYVPCTCCCVMDCCSNFVPKADMRNNSKFLAEYFEIFLDILGVRIKSCTKSGVLQIKGTYLLWPVSVGCERELISSTWDVTYRRIREVGICGTYRRKRTSTARVSICMPVTHKDEATNWARIVFHLSPCPCVIYDS